MKTQIAEFSKQVKAGSDRLMNFFLPAFFLIGLLLSFYYDTWLIGTGVGSLCLLAYYSAKLFLPHSDLYQYVLSAVVGIFMAQYIYQMHGMFEMHFFAFIGSAILITYRNWKLQIPLAVVVLIHHAVFGYLQFSGYEKVYFTQLDYITLHTFIIHILLATAIFSLCGFWSYSFKRAEEKLIANSFKIGKLEETYKQREMLTIMSEDLKASNKKLQEANTELALIFNTVEEVLFSVDLVNFHVIEMSAACKRIYGYSPIEFIANRNLWMKVIHPADKYIIRDFSKKLREGKTTIRQYRIIHKDKSILWIETKIIPTMDRIGNVTRIDGISYDITERVRLENKLNEERKQKQQQITAAVITAQENERSFLGEELHDNINPILATAKLYIECAINSEDMQLNLLKDSKGFITTAMNEIRTLSKSLIAPTLGEIALADAVKDLVGNLERVKDIGFITYWKGLDESILTDNLKLTVYRIIQEQLNNIFKHANAKTIFIDLKQDQDILELSIKDDGIGFDTAQKRTGVGLQNIISRTELLNGKVTINSEPGNGCELIVSFDVQPRQIGNRTIIRA